MKAIYLTKYGNADKAFEIKETEIPEARPGYVVIRSVSSGINFADIIARRGMYPDAPKNPAVLGYDVSGYVHSIGEGVEGFEIGEKVVALTRFGGYAEYAETMKEAVVKLPDNYDFDQATSLATQACTAYYCAEEMITLHKGDKVLIHAAAGGVGSVLVQIAKHRGCTVFGTASTKKLDYLKELGVDYPIDYTSQDFKAEIESQFGEKCLDVVFDSLGGQVYKNSKKLLAPTGRIVIYGAAEQMKTVSNKLKILGLAFGFGLTSPINLLMASQGIIAVNMLRVADYKAELFNHVFKNVIQMASQGIINPRLDKVFKAENVADAHEYVESRKSMGKVVLSWA
jgi:NADPH2:quinone reductase